MNSKNKKGFFLVFILVAVFPVAFLFIFMNIEKHSPKVDLNRILPIYGPKDTFTNFTRNGKPFLDTAYFQIPNFSFINQNGDTITKERVMGHVLIVDFFFTTCKSICIDMHRNMQTVQDAFLKENEVLILSHTVDPETDSVGQLFKYGIEHQVNSKIWNLLTGNKQDIYKMARNGYFITATQGDGGSEDFIHDQKFCIIDKEGRIRGYYNGTDPEQVKKLIDATKALLASYHIPLRAK